MVKPEKIPESWACLGHPSRYVMKELRTRPRRIQHISGTSYITKDGIIRTSWSVVASLSMRGFIRLRPDDHWEWTGK